MSDIGPIPALDRLVFAFYVLLIVGPPVVLGVVFLLVHIFVPNREGRLVALYFVTSMAAVAGGMWWASIWLNDSALFDYALPVALASTTGAFLFFMALRWLVRKIFRRKKKAGANGD